ncbi:putative secreted protein [Cupriavidus taiwanensis]|nr:putative secreted protein [Cupriavidus taiwanensis]
MDPTRRALTCCAALLPLLGTARASGSAYPAKPIRLVVPFVGGGPTDILSRAYASQMSQFLGQPVIVENKPGAGGSLGVDVVAKAVPDGYTIGLGTNGPLAINLALFGKLPYDPRRDITPITLFAFVPNVLVVSPSMGVNDLDQLLRLLRANDGKYSYASGGNGTSQHMAGEMFKTMARVNVAHVPYKGESMAITDVIGGQVAMSFSSLAASLPHLRSGRLIPLAVTSAERSPILPGLPTLAEKGFRKYEATAWYGIIAPPHTSPEIVARLHAASLRAFASPEVVARLAALGATAAPTAPAEFAAFIDKEIVRWAPVVKASGATVD